MNQFQTMAHSIPRSSLAARLTIAVQVEEEPIRFFKSAISGILAILLPTSPSSKVLRRRRQNNEGFLFPPSTTPHRAFLPRFMREERPMPKGREGKGREGKGRGRAPARVYQSDIQTASHTIQSVRGCHIPVQTQLYFVAKHAIILLR